MNESPALVFTNFTSDTCPNCTCASDTCVCVYRGFMSDTCPNCTCASDTCVCTCTVRTGNPCKHTHRYLMMHM